jgi:hypothetical protein
VTECCYCGADAVEVEPNGEDTCEPCHEDLARGRALDNEEALRLELADLPRSWRHA